MKKRAFIGIFVLAAIALVIGATCAAQTEGEAGETEKVILILNESMSFDDAKQEIDFILCVSKSLPRDLEIIHGISVELPSLLSRAVIRLPAIDKVLPNRKVTLLPPPKPIAF